MHTFRNSPNSLYGTLNAHPLTKKCPHSNIMYSCTCTMYTRRVMKGKGRQKHYAYYGNKDIVEMKSRTPYEGFLVLSR